MSRALNNRVTALEQCVSPPVSVPQRVEVDWLNGETDDEAKAKFNAKWGEHIKGRHCLLIVPKKPSTPDEEVIFARMFKEQQLASMENA